MTRVLIADKLSLKAVDILQARGLTVDVKTGMSEAELAVMMPQYDGLLVRSATRVTPAILERADKLKVIARAGIGVDNIDLPSATAKGVIVMNTPHGNAVTTAEHTIALMMSMARRIPAADASVRAGKWEKTKFMGVELNQKTLGIIGCGNIGALVAQRALAMGMKVVVHDPYLTEDRAKQLTVQLVSMIELLAQSDFITLHVPLNDATRHLINEPAIKRMKKGVRIINCARGGLVDEDALCRALETGHVAAAALDVFVMEPPGQSPLFAYDQVVVTPHLGASTEEAQEQVALQAAEQVADYLLNGTVRFAVNVPNVATHELIPLKPYLLLVEWLGGMIGQLIQQPIKGLIIEYDGLVSALNTQTLTANLAAALLRPTLAAVNPVSAMSMLSSRGVDVSEMRSEHADDYHTLIRVRVQTDQETHSFAGTLFGGTKPRIIEIDGVHIEAELGAYVLYVRNNDQPGLIGQLGTLLGKAGINIATFHLGRTKPGGQAAAIMVVDQKPAPFVLAQLQQSPNILAAQLLEF